MPKISKKQLREKRKKSAAKARKSRLGAKETLASKRPQPWEAPKMVMHQIPDVFPESLSRDDRLKILREAGANAKEEFEEKYSKILRWFEVYDPVYLLSYCATYFLTYPNGIDPEAEGSMDFHVFYIEILQAFSLMIPRCHSEKPLLFEADELQAEMKEIGKLMSFRAFDIPGHISIEEDLHAYGLRMQMIQQTTAIRNWAYFHQMEQVTLDLALSLDKIFEDQYKLKASTFFSLLTELTLLVTENLNRHRKKVQRFFYKKNHSDIIAAYNDAFPENIRIEGQAVEQMWRHAGEDRGALITRLVSYSDLRLGEIYSFSIEQAHSLIRNECTVDELAELLNKISYKFGDLKESNQEHFILGNPIQSRPFIRVEEDVYFSGTWCVLPHLKLGILESMVWKDEVSRKKYSEAKSKYLEDKLEELVLKGFPHGCVYRGSEWIDPMTENRFENDITVVIDSFALVIEAKSGIVSDPAKRGAPDDLFETLRRLIEEPSQQALRFIEYLKSDKRVHELESNRGRGRINCIDSSKINYYIPLGVTFYHLGMVGSNLKKLIAAKVTDRKLEELAPSINFTDLEIVFDLLTSEAEKIHYLARRREFEAHMDYEGDELDLLGLYLDQGFNIGDAEYSKEMKIIMHLKSKELDPYIVGTSEGRNVRRPSLEMSKWWKDIISTVIERQTEGWMETCYILLNSTKEEQLNFKRNVNALKKQILRGRMKNAHNWVVLGSGPERRRYIIVGYPFTTHERGLRNNIMAQIFEETEAENARGVVVIGIDLNKDFYPYSVLARRASTELFDVLTLN